MRYLIDTHVLLWAAKGDPQLSQPVNAILVDESETVFVSAISGYEIANKFRLGKLLEATVMMRDFESWVRRLGFELLPLTTAHAVRAGLFEDSIETRSIGY